jgi:hypothetical protein
MANQPRVPSDSSEFLSPDERELQKKLMEELSKRTAPVTKTDEELERESIEGKAAFLKKKGVDTQGYQERLDEFKKDADQAIKNRDIDRLLAWSAGFFKAAGGTSPYALKNFADGLGMTVQELGSVEKDYRKAEQARKDGIAALRQAQRAEAIGDYNALVAAKDKQQKAQETWQEKTDDINTKILNIFAIKEYRRSSAADANAARFQTTELAARSRGDIADQASRDRQETMRLQAVRNAYEAWEKAGLAGQASWLKANPGKTANDFIGDYLARFPGLGVAAAPAIDLSKWGKPNTTNKKD